jgi:hypothetical protein
MCWLSWNLGASDSWNPQGLSRPVMGLLYNQHNSLYRFSEKDGGKYFWSLVFIFWINYMFLWWGLKMWQLTVRLSACVCLGGMAPKVKLVCYLESSERNTGKMRTWNNQLIYSKPELFRFGLPESLTPFMWKYNTSPIMGGKIKLWQISLKNNFVIFTCKIRLL